MSQTNAGDTAKVGLLIALGAIALVYTVVFVRALLARRAQQGEELAPTGAGLATGFVTNFFDTLGIGSFAPTASIFRALRMVPDERIPGTLNVGHALPTIAQTFIFTRIVPVDATTLITMIVAAMLGSWLGAGVVSGLSRRAIQWGMGVCLMGAAALMTASLVGFAPAGGAALGVSGGKLAIAFAGNFLLGALMTLGIGLYAPCMILVSFLGMNVQSAFPIMMGSCAFLMPFASMRFIREWKFDVKAAVGLAIGGLPAVLIAAFIVKSLPLTALRWVVVVVVVYTSLTLLRAAQREGAAAPQTATP